MADDRLDHWRELADELGAVVPPDNEVQKPSETAQALPGEGAPVEVGDVSDAEEPSASSRVEAAVPARTPPARRDANGWAQLAEELGIEVPWEPEPTPPALPEEASLPVEPEFPSWDAPPPRESERQRKTDAEPRRDRESPRRKPAEDEREDDRRGRRRRKRRRPGEARERPAAPSSEPASSQAAIDDEPLPTEAEGDGEQPISEPLPASGAERGEDAGRSRGKRRRRRRGSGSRRESPVAGEPSESQPMPEANPSGSVSQPADRVEADDEDDFASDDDLEAEGQGGEPGARSERSLHRAIPSWFEAVNVVVSANLESRAKNPDRKSGNRGRGGHDRRGRDRGSDKPH